MRNIITDGVEASFSCYLRLLLGKPRIRQNILKASLTFSCLGLDFFIDSFIVAPALAGRHRRASFRPFVRSSVRTFVRPSIRQHLTWVSCERNFSFSFAPIVLKLCTCFLHCMRICMWIGHNCWISFCHFFDIVNLVIFHPDYIDRGYLL